MSKAVPDQLLIELADWLADAAQRPWGHEFALGAGELESIQHLATRFRAQAQGIPQPFGEGDERLLRRFAARMRRVGQLWAQLAAATPEERAAARQAEHYSRAVEALADRLAHGDF